MLVIFLFSDTSRLWFLKNINKISNLKINDADELTSQSFDYDPDDVLFEEEFKGNEYTNTNSWQYKFKNKIEIMNEKDYYIIICICAWLLVMIKFVLIRPQLQKHLDRSQIIVRDYLYNPSDDNRRRVVRRVSHILRKLNRTIIEFTTPKFVLLVIVTLFQLDYTPKSLSESPPKSKSKSKSNIFNSIALHNFLHPYFTRHALATLLIWICYSILIGNLIGFIILKRHEWVIKSRRRTVQDRLKQQAKQQMESQRKKQSKKSKKSKKKSKK
ncbi:hypothetical protein M0812_04595 [Anaeramoeba flamelloides]|uniref:Copper transporter n=1 Tax=Anaeramoeba flamelloides TaxID=1746091 RepID=A0AAV8AFY4_9EUKA|nr:hypothetical protein M0812_04595 [Anaeramoeba flamelloides]